MGKYARVTKSMIINFTRFFFQQIETFCQTPQSEELDFLNFEHRLLEVIFLVQFTRDSMSIRKMHLRQ